MIKVFRSYCWISLFLISSLWDKLCLCANCFRLGAQEKGAGMERCMNIYWGELLETTCEEVRKTRLGRGRHWPLKWLKLKPQLILQGALEAFRVVPELKQRVYAFISRSFAMGHSLGGDITLMKCFPVGGSKSSSLELPTLLTMGEISVLPWIG